MNNKKIYKKLILLDRERIARLKEIELKGYTVVFNFVSKYIYSNNLNEFFVPKLVENNETEIYLCRDNKKFSILRIGNRQIKNNLIKKLENLKNYLKKNELMKLEFTNLLKKEKMQFFFSDDKQDLHFEVENNNSNVEMILFSPIYNRDYILINEYLIKMKTVTKKYNYNNSRVIESKFTFNYPFKLSLSDIKTLIYSTIEEDLQINNYK